MYLNYQSYKAMLILFIIYDAIFILANLPSSLGPIPFFQYMLLLISKFSTFEIRNASMNQVKLFSLYPLDKPTLLSEIPTFIGPGSFASLSSGDATLY